MDIRPEELEKLESLKWPTVRVDVESRYRLLDADPMSGRWDDPLLSKVGTKFIREFAWGRHTHSKPAEVLVQILPLEVEEEEEEEEEVEEKVEEEEEGEEGEEEDLVDDMYSLEQTGPSRTRGIML